MELIVLLLLILLNGILAMSELAVVSSRKARLQQRAEEGVAGARAALELAENPNRFLSTVQIGITLIGIMAGAVGGTALAGDIAAQVGKIDALAPYANHIGLAGIVLLTAYLSLILGELVPKRLAIHNPERVAAIVAPAMRRISTLAYPLVWLLSFSTEAVLKVLGLQSASESVVTEEEIQMLLREGAEAGIFDLAEQELVAGVFRLDDMHVSAVMTPRTEVVYMLADDPPERIREKLDLGDHSRFPVCQDNLDHVIGVVKARDLLRCILHNQPIHLRDLLQPAQFIPEASTVSDALDLFRRSGNPFALVLGEHGGCEGVVTMSDVVNAVIGDVEEQTAVQREDGSWLVDGLMAVEQFKNLLGIEDLMPDEHLYQTVAGFVVTHQGRIPAAGDHFLWGELRFEVVDMDGKRVDKVLVERIPPP